MTRPLSLLTHWWAAPVFGAGLTPILYLAGSIAERAAVTAAAAVALIALVGPQWRQRLGRMPAILLLAATASLALHLLADDFAYRHVWLYSAQDLSWYLKLANLWGGDESTLLFLATGVALAIPTLCRRAGWAGPGALVLLLPLATGAIVWSPFAGTPPEDLARLPSQGMNAHLMSLWMAFHPPQLFAAYILLLAPAGAALQALSGRGGDWGRIAPVYMRAGWLVLTGGLAFGMWWAYEDITFGQIWHWDPVQTSVFVVWALASAQGHCLRRYRANGTFATLSPLLGLLAGVAALLSLAVTRTGTLASSHRYVGETSFPVYATGATVLAAMTLAAFLRGQRAASGRRSARDEPVTVIRIVIIGFCTAAAVALLHLAEAFASAWLALPRPEALKPFFETLTRWSTPQELAELRRAFDQWDVYGYGINRFLAPVLILLGLAGGHFFLPLRRRWRWLAVIGALAGAVAAALFWQPFETHFRGIGMTSGRTVAIFGWLDAAGVAVAFLLFSLGLWLTVLLRRHRGRPLVWRYYLPVGAIHAGAAIAVAAAAIGTIFDSYAQKTVQFPQDFGKPLAFPDGYSVAVTLMDFGAATDGGRGIPRPGGFQAVAEASWWLERGDTVLVQGAGHTVFRDSRPPPGDKGPVRLICEMLDYRYARYVDGSGRVMHPFIHRGLWRDVQIWFPSPDFRAESDGRVRPQPGRVPIVLKTYPMMTWLWLGLALVLAGAGTTFGYTLTDRRRRRRCAPAVRASPSARGSR